MRKIFLTIFMTLTIISCSNNIDDARDAMKEKYPNAKIDSIKKVIF